MLKARRVLTMWSYLLLMGSVRVCFYVSASEVGRKDVKMTFDFCCVKCVQCNGVSELLLCVIFTIPFSDSAPCLPTT